MRGLLRTGNTNSLGLIDAAQNGDIERVKAKLKAGKDVNSRDEVRLLGRPLRRCLQIFASMGSY